MDGSNFDLLTRLFAASLSRRVTLGGLAGVVLALRDMAQTGTGLAKKKNKKKNKKKKKDRKHPPPNPVCKGGGDFCAGSCCPPLHGCVPTVVFGENACCPSAQICTSETGATKKCCPASSEPVTGCCVTNDPQGNVITFCCYGNRTCDYDEDKNGSCCLSGEVPCGGSCCEEGTSCCARYKNGIKEYACCPAGARCMKDRPDLRPCCSNC